MMTCIGAVPPPTRANGRQIRALSRNHCAIVTIHDVHPVTSTRATVISYNSLYRIDHLLVRFGAVIWISVLLGTIIPALVAAHYHVFYKEDIEKRIIARELNPAADILSQEDHLNRRVKAINAAISGLLQTTNDSAEVKALVSLRLDIQEELSKLDEQIVVAPFYLNDLMVAWSAMYIALGTLLFILVPKLDRRFSHMSWRIALAIGAIYPLYQGPVWLRNFVLSNEQRRVYGFANFDICAATFWMQEINTFIWLLLIAFLWHRWFAIYVHRSNELARDVDTPPDMKSLTRLGDTFLHWQVSSVILASGFMFFTGVYWSRVIVSKDRRYLISAVVIHLVWALSWMLASLPLFVTWQDFSRKKMRLTLAAYQGNAEGQNTEAAAEALEKLTPIALWNGFGSALTAALSFVFPIFHALAK